MSRRHVIVPRDRFAMAVRHIIERGEYPSGARVNRELQRGGRYLSPVECQWRREVAAEAGVTLNGTNLDGSKGGKRRPPMRVNGGTCTNDTGRHDMRPGPTAIVDGKVGAVRQCAHCKWIAPGVVTVADPFIEADA